MITIARSAVLLCSCVFWSGLLSAEGLAAGKATNRLANEASPYLRQHAHNPVDWFPWGKEAFAKARRENKPILLSVGYSTCHWCHIMERESFSDSEIAAVLNEHFVAIKVDRERRPEIDETYMIATEMLNQAGGWPNNVFLTPELKPFAAITYLPKTQFKEMMEEINTHWTSNPGPIMAQAEQVSNVMAAYMRARVESRSITPQLLRSLVDQATQGFDDFNGGIGVAPKFPQESLLLFLLEQAERNLIPRAREVALTTLDNILSGGIRDHIAGGFHRYAVDPAWRVPHFEKMLYNQALLAQALVRAYRMTGRRRYATALRETLDYVIRDMRLASDGFATASDAESKTAAGDKVEGAFFVWTPAEIAKVLNKEDSAVAQQVYGISADGNFNGKSIPYLTAPVSELAEQRGESRQDFSGRLRRIKERLNNARAKRSPPLRDDKVLTGWNALLIKALAEASMALGSPDYIKTAERAANFLWTEHYTKHGELRRFSFEGQANLRATQPDYAYLAIAFVALYDATGTTSWLKRAEQLAAEMHELFLDKDAGDYVMAKTDDPIPAAKVRTDQPVPSGNSVALELYAKLDRRTLSTQYRQRAHDLLAALSGISARAPAQSGYALKSADELLRGELGSRQYVGRGQVRLSLEQIDATTAKLHMSINPGWHVNSNKPLEDDFIATSITPLGTGTPTLANVAYPKAVVRKLGFADSELALYEGKSTITVKFSPAGPPRALQVRAQACNDQICLNPETITLPLRPLSEQ
ncbi:MAG: DUF255 domain-containing protein [Hyphomicrobiaceae bacterium]